ncbi:MAG: SDR family NAD(P)-dependent oxidoreductase [Dehalococcoidia bacterium]
MDLEKPLAGRVALITGATGGLGVKAREVFASAGATVVRRDRDDPGSPWRWFDATDPAEAEAAVENAVRSYGKIDIMVNLVGAWAPQPHVSEMPDDTLDDMFRINFRSAFVMTRAVLPHMIVNGWGRIINVGAKQALRGDAGNAAYSAAKAAVIALTESTAAEASNKGVTANVIIPSVIDTPANRRGMPQADFSRWVKPEHLADAMVFLCTESGGSINGARIPVWNRS